MTGTLTVVVARATNGVIGRDGALPWRLSADLARFKALTIGKPMIMGRKTFDSLGRPLPRRRHVVLTRTAGWTAIGAEVAHDVDAALALAGDGEAAVIGGADIYRLFLPLARRIELTEVRADVAGDTLMPPLGAGWREIARAEHPAQGEFPPYAFVTLVRDL